MQQLYISDGYTWKSSSSLLMHHYPPTNPTLFMWCSLHKLATDNSSAAAFIGWPLTTFIFEIYNNTHYKNTISKLKISRVGVNI